MSYKFKQIKNHNILPRDLEVTNGQTVKDPGSIKGIMTIFIFIIVIFSLASFTGSSLIEFIKEIPTLFTSLTRMFPPDFAALTDPRLKLIPLLFETIQIAVEGTIIGCILAVPFAFLATSKFNRLKPVYHLVRFVLAITRTIPLLIYALILTYILSFGAFAGMIATIIFTFSIVTKMLFEQFENIGLGSFEAMEAAGLTTVKSFSTAIVPQVIPIFLSICLYTFEINVRASTILGLVGAGGIGLQMQNQLAKQNYQVVGMIIVLIFILVIIIELLSRIFRMLLNDQTIFGKPRKHEIDFVSASEETEDEKIKQALVIGKKLGMKTVITKIIIFFAIGAIFIWAAIGIALPDEFGGAEVVNNILREFLRPNLTKLVDFTSSGIPYLMLETLAIAALGTIIAAVLALPLAFMASTKTAPRGLNALAVAIVAFLRSIPALIYAIIFVMMVGQGAFAGVLTFSIASVGMLTKLYTEAIEDIDVGVLEAMDSLGVRGIKKSSLAIIPQVIVGFISTIIYRFEINFKDASTLGIVGAGGIGTPLVFALNYQKWDEAAGILIALIIVVLIVEQVSNLIRKKIA